MKTTLMINCKEATLLIEKKQEKQISVLDRIKLLLHLMICELCRRFQKQSKLISDSASHIETHHTLTKEQEEKLKGIIEKAKK
jgi:hypothetical protein